MRWRYGGDEGVSDIAEGNGDMGDWDDRRAWLAPLLLRAPLLAALVLAPLLAECNGSG